MDYVIVVPVEFYPIDAENAACESAFVEHLKLLKQHVKEYAPRIHIVAPAMSQQNYETRKNYLTTVNEAQDGIVVTCAFPADMGRLKYTLTQLLPVYRRLKPIIKNAVIVHSGPSNNLFHLFEILAIYLAVKYRRSSLFFIDIDERDSARMDYTTGHLSLKSYLLSKYLYNPFVSLQIKYAVKNCTLLLLKSKSLVRDFGKGAGHVKDFLDTAHSADAVINDTKMQQKISLLNEQTFKLVYFGRLTEYKGIKDMITATALTRSKHKLNVELTIIGAGEQDQELKDFIQQTSAESFVHLKAAIPYGEQLFNELYQQDCLLAAPQRQDTPRSVFDAMSNGLITIAYDTYYYQDLVSTGAVITTPWLDAEAMSDAIAQIASDRDNQADMIKSAVTFARQNTQEYWLEKRNNWLIECLKNP